MVKQISVHTHGRAQFVDITAEVQAAVRELGVGDGVVTVFVPHTTAGITINEHADPDVVRDIGTALERAVPWEAAYRHAEGNAAAHVKASLLGASARVIVAGGRLQLGTWQGIFFCEFDGPRSRQVWVEKG
ncbi:MAG: YjbQ family protein [Kiritimatiellae bacterium]|nr:YjbQ family protein [Kiritimatiellia bacterium]